MVKRVISPIIGTVCPEGYKISKNGKCIKDKTYVKPQRKLAQRSATVCLEGYKITKNGKCIKDKKYKLVIDKVPVTPEIQKMVEAVKPETVQKTVEQLAMIAPEPVVKVVDSDKKFGNERVTYEIFMEDIKKTREFLKKEDAEGLEDMIWDLEYSLKRLNPSSDHYPFFVESIKHFKEMLESLKKSKARFIDFKQKLANDRTFPAEVKQKLANATTEQQVNKILVEFNGLPKKINPASMITY